MSRGEDKSIYELFNAVRGHPDFVVGAIFTKNDIPEGKLLPPVWKSKWVEGPMLIAGDRALETFCYAEMMMKIKTVKSGDLNNSLKAEDHLKDTDLLIQRVHKNAKIPKYATSGSAGMDLYCVEDVHLPPMTRILVPTGLKMAIPEGYEGQIRPRSSLALKCGVTVLNTPGTIDSDYRGEVKIILANLSNEDVGFSAGDRIAQIVFSKVAQLKTQLTLALPATERGDGGFGSTGQ